MIQKTNAAAPGLAVAAAKQANANNNGQANGANQNGNAAKPEKTVTKKAVPTVSALDARALAQRQQIAAALYDRSFTFNEGVKALKRQDAIQAYASSIAAQEGGASDKDLAKLDRKLDRAQAQIEKLTTNAKGADLDSDAAVDGSAVDTVQTNLAKRIAAGLKDGTLTQQEADTLLARQQEITDVETKLRESGGILTAAEQKDVLDQLRKTADQINAARRNEIGVKAPVATYADSIDKRQAALEKQLEQGLKIGSLTANEADAIRAEFQAAADLETGALANGKVDWKEYVGVSNALNLAEIKLYELQRNADGKQLADKFVDQNLVDQRQSQQLESLTRGIDNGRLTNSEAASLLEGQQAIDALQTQLANGGMTRGEYLRLQIEMNNFSVANSDAQANAQRWTGLFATPEQAPAPAPAAAMAEPAPAAPAPEPAPSPASGNGNSQAGGASGTAGNAGSNAGGNGAAASGNPNAGGANAGGNGNGNAGGVGNGNAGGSTGTGGNVGNGGSTGATGGTTGSAGTGGSTASTGTTNETPASSTNPASEKQEAAVVENQPAPGMPVVLKALDEIKDIFGDLVNGMLKTHTNETGDLHKRFVDHVRELHENEERRAEKKGLGQREHRFGEVRNAEDERKVGSYVATAASAKAKPEATIVAKVA